MKRIPKMPHTSLLANQPPPPPSGPLFKRTGNLIEVPFHQPRQTLIVTQSLKQITYHTIRIIDNHINVRKRKTTEGNRTASSSPQRKTPSRLVRTHINPKQKPTRRMTSIFLQLTLVSIRKRT
uniref:Uncharacterized protein n=1 Tax=Gossypium raimondii TaxID=29730 RepID=A0A0D2USD5_GOSRA|nr:hypothetical protein B456_009G279100 [Gossypium raimondii]